MKKCICYIYKTQKIQINDEQMTADEDEFTKK
jgi:hypothetical protein